jgi:hypothetical protein
VCSKLSDLPGDNKFQKIVNSITMAISLWVSWEIHIKNSKYPFKWYGCVQIENIWLKNGKHTPPYVVFNSENPEKIQHFSIFNKISSNQLPDVFKKIDLTKSKGIVVKKAHFEDNNIVWRLCYS